MKRIVNGVTYNTDTSTKLATWEGENMGDSNDEAIVQVLYQTRGGAYFLHSETTKKMWNESEREYQPKVTNSFEPLSPEAAHKWIMDGDVEIFSNPFDDPPEATAEAEPGATLYVRVPASLKRQIDEASKAAQMSGNVWVMRCVEKCLAGDCV